VVLCIVIDNLFDYSTQFPHLEPEGLHVAHIGLFFPVELLGDSGEAVHNLL
jgi:hypothetical protein